MSFVTATGDRVQIDYGVEPVINLTYGVTGAVRIEPVVRFMASGARIPVGQFSRLADNDIAFIDRSTLDFAALFLPKNTRTDPPLILPASFRTMGGRKGRSALIGLEGAQPEQIRHGVMIELIDIDLGTPTSRLAEVSSLVSQLCRGVVARIWPTRDPFGPIRGARFNGVSFDVREIRIGRAPVVLRDQRIHPLLLR